MCLAHVNCETALWNNEAARPFLKIEALLKRCFGGDVKPIKNEYVNHVSLRFKNINKNFRGVCSRVASHYKFEGYVARLKRSSSMSLHTRPIDEEISTCEP